MTKKTYLIIMIVAGIISLIGLISLVGGVRTVNVGAFIFPALISIWALYKYISNKKKMQG